MAVKHGFLPEFVPGTEEWGSYVERAEHYFVANGVDTQETRRAVLLSSCGAPTYRLIRNLSTPLKPGEKTYKEIVESEIIYKGIGNEPTYHVLTRAIRTESLYVHQTHKHCEHFFCTKKYK